MIQPALQRLKLQLREYFLLEEVSQRLATRTIPEQQAVRAHHDAALRHLRAAQALRGPELTPASLSLYRQGGLLLAHAFLMSSAGNTDPATLNPEVAFHRIEEALAKEKSEAPVEFAESKHFLLSADLLQLDRLSAEEAESVVAKLDAGTKWLAERIDPRSPRELKLTSALRIATVGLALAGLLVMFFIKLTAPKNLALHRPASSSSAALTTTPDGAVDGSKNGRFGFHSGEEDSPFWTVDLGGATALSEIRVFGRSDCCFDQSVPIGLEISSDGASFHEIARRTEGFSESDPWVLRPPAADVARFVRLRTLRRSYLVLGEVEINGRESK